jgi:hypothetical protein
MPRRHGNPPPQAAAKNRRRQREWPAGCHNDPDLISGLFKRLQRPVTRLKIHQISVHNNRDPDTIAGKHPDMILKRLNLSGFNRLTPMINHEYITMHARDNFFAMGADAARRGRRGLTFQPRVTQPPRREPPREMSFTQASASFEQNDRMHTSKIHDRGELRLHGLVTKEVNGSIPYFFGQRFQRRSNS